MEWKRLADLLREEWISVKDQLPESGKKVLAIDMQDKNPSIELLVYFGEHKGAHEWSSYSCNTFDPTHWMPLPELPNE